MKQIVLIMTLSLSMTLAMAAEQSAIITGEITELQDTDVATLITDAYGSPGFTGFSTKRTFDVKNHRFYIKIPVGNDPVRFSLRFNNKLNPLQDFNRYTRMSMWSYYLLGGDSLVIRKQGDDLVFGGNHAGSYQVYQELKRQIRNSSATLATGPENMEQQFKSRDTLAMALLRFIDEKRKELNHDLYTLYRSEALTVYFGKGNLLYMMTDSMRRIAVKALADYESPEIMAPASFQFFNQQPVLKYADLYSKSLFWQYQLDSCYKTFRPFSLPAYYTYVNKRYSGLLRERLITNILFDKRTEALDMTTYLSEALQSTTDSDFKNILGQLITQRVPGAYAYNFELVDEKGKVHRLSDYRGKTVLLDFWYTGCGNCIKVQPYLRKIEAKMRKRPVVFLSVNVDKSRVQWLKSVASGEYTTSDVVNLYTSGQQLKHPICRFFAIDSYPTLILIDPKGRLIRNPEDPRKDEGKDLEQLISNNF
jgi:thiol-disulfide isomerase/thioredoxin